MAKVELNRGNTVEFSTLECGTYFIYLDTLWLKVAESSETGNVFNFYEDFFDNFDNETVEVVPTEAITIKVG